MALRTLVVGRAVPVQSLLSFFGRRFSAGAFAAKAKWPSGCGAGRCGATGYLVFAIVGQRIASAIASWAARISISGGPIMKKIVLCAALLGSWPALGFAQTTQELVNDGKNTENVT